ncbi:MAG TPA: ATP-binding protein, partial [Prosthecobacter sp.]|nr:ATP-binding protein [Prosthecobacter sp.]
HAVAQLETEKLVSVRVRMNDNHSIEIAVSDNGIGIVPANLKRIFQHGFTTKKNGHGFGLHSGALTARELGGKLTAHSAGLGQGATFVLELPIQTDSRQN